MAENTRESSVTAHRVPDSDVADTRAPTHFLIPAVDIYETGEGLVVVADVPGVSREGLDIQVREGVLTINGKIQQIPRDGLTYGEFDLISYHREFRLGEKVDQGNISAKLERGVLTLTLPKVEESRPRQIEVKGV